ncbi:hypothetical protein BC936DRAFT_141840 [Jimgerdemannia flammicorona]|uniref:Uncharacterized protein n=2 Tax=Jimgerdemannia flammicorona TaxID=994334 RepID=A0A433DFW7_9FUNG|nr:hypothetical protein BC936DRAFT_141840 [Jimgerdemannia flammicorona]RUS33377.1 hypothetical protein BC938DRAFT_471976 [Jimgerdemannia flammicorona]
MAEEFPESTFVGVDLATFFNAVDPDDVPINCSFQQASILHLPFEDETFDFVIQRFLGMAYSPSDWETALKELIRVLKPGGWIELAEGNFIMQRPPACYQRFYNSLAAVCLSRGVDISLLHAVPMRLAETGVIEDITIDYLSIPTGWHGRIGDICLASFGAAMRALRPAIAPTMGLDNEGYEAMCQEVLNGFREKKTWFKAPYGFGMKRVEG